MITVKKFIVNPLRENTYIVFNEAGETIIFDAGFYYDEEMQEIQDFISGNGLKPSRLINTHCHFDHLMGVGFVREKYNLMLECHQDDAFLVERAARQASMFGIEMDPVAAPDQFLREGDKVSLGDSELTAIHIPGHSPGHLVFYSASDQFVIAGDVLFYGSIGRTDLPGGSYELLTSNIHRKLMVLPPETTVYCGHGPETTIGFEKENNPFLT
jgi:hydroxyacylglutathione hydrolase